jgi:hypothetical protein
VKVGWTAWLVMVGAGAMLAGCGFTDLEMAAKQRQIDALVTEVSALKAGQGAACKTGASLSYTKLATASWASPRR